MKILLKIISAVLISLGTTVHTAQEKPVFSEMEEQLILKVVEGLKAKKLSYVALITELFFYAGTGEQAKLQALLNTPRALDLRRLPEPEARKVVMKELMACGVLTDCKEKLQALEKDYMEKRGSLKEFTGSDLDVMEMPLYILRNGTTDVQSKEFEEAFGKSEHASRAERCKLAADLYKEILADVEKAVQQTIEKTIQENNPA
jgi:hypothetical protein